MEMADLSTTYMGTEIKNPVVVAACSMSAKLDSIRQVADAGAAAMVIKSLFEEQIQHEIDALDQAAEQGADAFAESLSYFPKVEHAGAREHLMWIEKARAAVDIPLIGSLNAVHPGAWVDFARQMSESGVNAIELNVYSVQAAIDRSGADAEQEMLDTFSAVREATELPIAVKLGPFYTSVGNVVQQLEERGANAVVLFNRFLQPDIDIEHGKLLSRMSLSNRSEVRLPVRWIALLYGRVGIDLIANSGIAGAEDVAKCILAGATAVQVASVLYRGGVHTITSILTDLEAWMQSKGYGALADFRGKLSQKDFQGDACALERAHYLDFLTSANKW
jgi:dihydroorotate dehydrogenase (fumarate)